jgi:hypothetical protein
MLRAALILLICVSAAKTSHAQKLDSLFFNLYTDSLKKGTFNYINVDGKFSDGSYLPLTAKELKFSASAGKFDGNSLFIDSNFRDDKVKVKVTLISNPSVSREITIYIKRHEPVEKLKTEAEVMRKRGK